MTLKTCSTCREEKPLEEFHRCRSREDGRQTSCKPCKIAYASKWNSDNKERHRSNMRRHLTGKRVKDPLFHRLSVMPARARGFGAPVEKFDSLDLELYWLCNGISTTRCYYTGEPLGPDFHLDHKTPLSRGGAHAVDNIVPCTPAANTAKRAMTESEFRSTLTYTRR
ncbi:HNH endonuclease [Mycobacterium phage Zeeculate]|nr:HNH endonuclease [Mycobacterium phage Zeeculate]